MISKLQPFTDKLAISLSMLCAIHCLILPLFIVLLPNLTALTYIGDESFHLWMLCVVIPTSLFALGLGCRKHERYYLVGFGVIGLAFMLSAVLLAETYLDETWEKVLTLLGASVIALGHYKNYRLCQKQDSCTCSLNHNI